VPRFALIAAVKRAALAFLVDDALTLAAALAFYTVLSFAPLVLLSVWATSSFGSDTQEAVLHQIAALAGNDAKRAAAAILANSVRLTLGSFAGIAAAVIVAVSATTIFAQLQLSLNAIWKFPAKTGNPLRAWLRRWLLALGMLAATLAMIAAALLANVLLRMALQRLGLPWFPLKHVFALVVATLLFAVWFRYLPDRRLRWRDTFAGALISAALFVLGNLAIGQVLTHSNFGSAYGSMGSVVVFLVWVYYSALVFLFGAELIDVAFVTRADQTMR